MKKEINKRKIYNIFMKKIRLIIITAGLLLSLMSSAQTLNFRMANPNILYISGTGNNYFRFDIQVMASVPGTYIWVGQVNLSFNTAVLSSVATDWVVTPAALVSGTYIIDPDFGTTAPRFLSPMPQSVSGNEFLIGWTPNPAVSNYAPSPDYHNMVPTTWTTIVNVRVKITGSSSDVTGNSFIHAGMDTQQQYHTGINTNSTYTVAYSDEFTNLYVGRIFANSAWTQVGVTPAGVDWSTSVGTSVWDGTAFIPTTGVSLASNLRIHNPATLTIPNAGQLTVAGNTDVLTTNGLIIQSDATGTGSLITATASGAGSATVQRWMSAGKWNIVSSPLSGQSVSNFLTNNAGIASNGSNLRGILEYLPSSNAWSTPTTTGPAGSLGGGKGFSMRLQGTTPGTNDAAVIFTGALQAGAQPASASAGFWNSIGNPYTSAIRLTSNITPTPPENFLTANAANIVSGSGIYVWQAPDASNGLTGNYTTYSNAVAGDFQQGQAFMVNATASSLSFTSAMQIHNTSLVLKSSGNVWPTIKLKASVGEQKSSTIIAFNSGMTKGLDQTYDASLLKGATDLIVYTKLVEDNGIPFAIQALPANDYEGMIIPVGLDFKTGGQVVFSAELTSMSSDAKVILEDKLLKKLTDLSKNDYSVTIAANSSISDRFQIHTSYLTTGTTTDLAFEKLSAYAYRNIEIRLKGTVSAGAVASLYDVQGRKILVKILEDSNLNIIPTPNIRTGIYMLSVNDHGKVTGFKIPVAE